MAREDYSASFALDSSAALRARADRFQQFQTVEVPRLRQIGMALNAVGVLLHNYLVYGHVSLRDAAFILGVLGGYALVAWISIRLLWTRIRWFDVADLFLNIDILALSFVVYVSGANHSLLWPVFLARPADQVARTFRRALYFAHLGPLAYVALMVYVSRVDHVDVTWSTELAKVVFLYFMAIYIALTAKTAEARRNKLAEARRTAEQAVRSADQRRRELEAALSKLETASKAKSEFLANVSHELRTPLNSVLGSSDLLLDSPLSREQREMVGVLRDSAESLTHVVNDILDLARVEARRMPLEQIPMRVRDVAGATLRMFTARVHQRPIELVCQVDRDVPDSLTGDPVRLRQVLTNLLGNAVKFTERGEIVLRVELEETRGARVGLRFSVRDTGIGIPKDRQAAIFDAFTQVDGSSTRKYGGTGLGLTIANELVGLMDGRLWVDSEPGRGSTFSFIAWFHSTGAEPGEAPWGARRLTILLADGPPLTQRALEEALAIWPADVRTASGGHTALAAADATRGSQPIDIAFIDAALEGIDAFELAARLRGAPYRVGRVVMLISHRAPATVAERAITQGALYLITPVTQQALTELLRGAFGTGPTGAALLPHLRAPLRPLRVLVADDHEVNQAVVGAVLKKWGHAVASALDGQEVLDKLASEPYDLVLMDLQMPVMDGLDATRRLRQREAASGAARTAVVAMTARAMEEDRERCLAAGMDGYLSKPLDQRALFDVLAGLAGPADVPSALPPPSPSSISTVISDPALVRHVAGLFLTTAPGQLERLQQALERGQADEAGAVAHSLKGAADYFAGADVAALIEIEDLCRAGRAERALARLGQARADVDALTARLRAFLQ